MAEGLLEGRTVREVRILLLPYPSGLIPLRHVEDAQLGEELHSTKLDWVDNILC